MRNRLGIVVITAAVLFAPHLIAADAPNNALSFTFSNADNTIAYRRSFGMFAGLISAGYSKYSYDSSDSSGNHTNNSSHVWSLGAGLRRYLAAKSQLQPFVQADFARSTPGIVAVGVGACGPYHNNTGTISGGAEYHVTPAISIEGRAGLSASSASTRCSSTDYSYRTDSRTLGTFRSAIGLNFYF